MSWRPDDEVSAYLDGALAETERAAFSAALGADPVLRAELAEVAEVRDLVRALPFPVPPDGMLDSIVAATRPVADLESARSRRRRPARVTAIVGAVAAAAALVVAVVVPAADRSTPALATDVRIHRAGSAAAGDPVSGLSPLATPMRFGR